MRALGGLNDREGAVMLGLLSAFGSAGEVGKAQDVVHAPTPATPACALPAGVMSRCLLPIAHAEERRRVPDDDQA